jgi:hypothetical protein
MLSRCDESGVLLNTKDRGYVHSIYGYYVEQIQSESPNYDKMSGYIKTLDLKQQSLLLTISDTASPDLITLIYITMIAKKDLYIKGCEVFKFIFNNLLHEAQKTFYDLICGYKADLEKSGFKIEHVINTEEFNKLLIGELNEDL